VSARRGRPTRWTELGLSVYSWLVIAYLVVPIAVMMLYSFNRITTALPQVSFAWNGFTLQWWRQWNEIPGLTESFWLSIRLAVLSTLVATICGTLIALALVRYRFTGKSATEQVLFANIAAPEIVTAASLLSFFVTIDLPRGFATLLLSHVALSVAYVAVTVRARLSGFDWTVEEAAQDLGADPWTTFGKVTLPLIFPGILAGGMMAFVLSVDDFITSNFVSGASVPFPVWVYGATRVGTPPQVLVFGSGIFIVGFLIAIASVVLARRRT
jgi:spermidine/putrescine transport system permease protein